MTPINYEKQLADQQELIALHEQLLKELDAMIIAGAADVKDDEHEDRIKLSDTRIRRWYTERKLETEREVHRQLAERQQAQQEYLAKMLQESLQQFTGLWARYDNLISRIGKHRIEHTEEYQMAEEIRRMYDNKFEGDNDKKALAFAELKQIVKRLADVK